MARRKAEENNVRKLGKSGSKSVTVTIPIEMIRELGWREKQRVVVKRVRGGVMIWGWRK